MRIFPSPRYSARLRARAAEMIFPLALPVRILKMRLRSSIPKGKKTLLLATTGISQSFGAHAPAATPVTSGLCAISRLCSKHSTNGESKCLRGKTSCGALTLDGGAWYAAPLSPRGSVSNWLRPRGLASTPVLHIHGHNSGTSGSRDWTPGSRGGP